VIDLFLQQCIGGCGISAVNDPSWIVDAESGKPSQISKDWLIYMNSNKRTQLTQSVIDELA
jgi:hypothetical protein